MDHSFWRVFRNHVWDTSVIEVHNILRPMSQRDLGERVVMPM
ncbi:MAG: hypothetical protein ACXAEX_16370 [Promethearchaeota archaeon]